MREQLWVFLSTCTWLVLSQRVSGGYFLFLSHLNCTSIYSLIFFQPVLTEFSNSVPGTLLGTIYVYVEQNSVSSFTDGRNGFWTLSVIQFGDDTMFYFPVPFFFS